MRITGGQLRGRTLLTLSGQQTRPTSDKVKQAVFNMIQRDVPDAYCLDMYGGSGGLAFEALSRGARHAVICEQHRQAFQIIKENCAQLRLEGVCQLLFGDCHRHLTQWQGEPFSLVFLDPPYAKQTIIDDVTLLITHGLLTPDAVIVCETDSAIALPDQIMSIEKWRDATYGQARIQLYAMSE